MHDDRCIVLLRDRHAIDQGTVLLSRLIVIVQIEADA